MVAEEIIQQWMQACCKTLAQYDLEAHLDLISKNVQVFGVPGFEVIDFSGWEAQCKYEFANKLIKAVEYQGLKILRESPTTIIFITLEIIMDADGNKIPSGIEAILTKEADDKWRVTHERVLSEDETRHANVD